MLLMLNHFNNLIEYISLMFKLTTMFHVTSQLYRGWHDIFSGNLRKSFDFSLPGTLSLFSTPQVDLISIADPKCLFLQASTKSYLLVPCSILRPSLTCTLTISIIWTYLGDVIPSFLQVVQASSVNFASFTFKDIGRVTMTAHITFVRGSPE